MSLPLIRKRFDVSQSGQTAQQIRIRGFWVRPVASKLDAVQLLVPFGSKLCLEKVRQSSDPVSASKLFRHCNVFCKQAPLYCRTEQVAWVTLSGKRCRSSYLYPIESASTLARHRLRPLEAANNNRKHPRSTLSSAHTSRHAPKRFQAKLGYEEASQEVPVVGVILNNHDQYWIKLICIRAPRSLRNTVSANPRSLAHQLATYSAAYFTQIDERSFLARPDCPQPTLPQTDWCVELNATCTV